MHPKMGAFLFKEEIMAIREIDYDLGLKSISPNIIQDGGTQGDHNATKLIFNINDELIKALDSLMKNSGDRILYRFDTWAADGTSNVGIQKIYSSGPIEYYLKEYLTRYAGKIRICLVFTLYNPQPIYDEMHTGMESFEYNVSLNIKSLPGYNGNKSIESVSSIAENITQATGVAEAAALRAENDRILTENAMQHFQKGSIIVFKGRNAKMVSEVDVSVDENFSAESTNPVENKSVDKRFSEIEENLNVLIPKVNEIISAIGNVTGDVERINAVIAATGRSEIISNLDNLYQDSNINSNYNRWYYKMIDNDSVTIWGTFKITPKENNLESENTYSSEIYSLPLPFLLTGGKSCVTGNCNNRANIKELNLIQNANISEVQFYIQSTDGEIGTNPIIVYLQIMGYIEKTEVLNNGLDE